MQRTDHVPDKDFEPTNRLENGYDPADESEQTAARHEAERTDQGQYTPQSSTDRPTVEDRPAAVAIGSVPEDAVAHATSNQTGESRHAETTHDAGDEGPRATAVEAGDSAPHRATGEHVLDPDLSTAYQERWRELQATFVDDPAAAVHSAEELVMELTTELSNAVTRRREVLSGSENGETSDTEELRTTLRTYREIMHRLLEV